MAKRRDIFKAMADHFGSRRLGASFPHGGFILPNGYIVMAYGNHEAMCQVIGTNLKHFIRSGAARWHYAYLSLGIDLPPAITEAQMQTIASLLNHFDPDITCVAHVRFRGKPRVKVFEEYPSPAVVIAWIKGAQ